LTYNLFVILLVDIYIVNTFSVVFALFNWLDLLAGTVQRWRR